MEDSRVCIGCGAKAPATETQYTLISARYGWRVIRIPSTEPGGPGIEWRCPECWRAYKKHAGLGDSEETAPSSRRQR
jgi:hypothetical protein